MARPPHQPTLFPYTTLFRSERRVSSLGGRREHAAAVGEPPETRRVENGSDLHQRGKAHARPAVLGDTGGTEGSHRRGASELESSDRKSTRLNSSHLGISYAV